MPYHSPHKFNHGFAAYSLKQSDNIEELKAVSLNLMHSNLQVTDGIYVILAKEDVRDIITSLGEKSISEGQDDKIILINAIQKLIIGLSRGT